MRGAFVRPEVSILRPLVFLLFSVILARGSSGLGESWRKFSAAEGTDGTKFPKSGEDRHADFGLYIMSFYMPIYM